MTVYRVPPECREEAALFSVVGQRHPENTLSEELYLEPGPILHLPEGATLLSSRSCRGSLRQRLLLLQCEPADRLWFLIDPLCHLFTLPCPDGAGQRICEEQSLMLRKKHPVYDSPEFVCQYCVIADHGQLRVHLFDTPQSIQEKLHLAESLDIENIIYIM